MAHPRTGVLGHDATGWARAVTDNNKALLLLAAEDRLLDRSRATTGPNVRLATVEKVTTKPDREGRILGED